MSSMLVINIIMNTIKQHSKGNNVHQRPFDITQFIKNRDYGNIIIGRKLKLFMKILVR